MTVSPERFLMAVRNAGGLFAAFKEGWVPEDVEPGVFYDLLDWAYRDCK